MKYGLLLVLLVLVGCAPPAPRARTVQDFLDDPEVMQGVLARCGADRMLELRDPECANARLAAQRIDASRDDQRAAHYAAESEKKLEEVRARKASGPEQPAPAFDPYRSPVTADPVPAAPGAPSSPSHQ